MPPRRRLRHRLQHILDAIEAIEHDTTGKTLDDCLADRMLRDAVERSFERVSEASRHIPSSFEALHPDVPWRQIAALGNVLRHEYDAIEDQVILRAIEAALPEWSSPEDAEAYDDL